jgi:hypothetical protein
VTCEGILSERSYRAEAWKYRNLKIIGGLIEFSLNCGVYRQKCHIIHSNLTLNNLLILR